MKLNNSPIIRDSLIMTALSFGLQLLSLLMNVFLTNRLGAASVGVISLVYSFFGFAALAASGNAYICVSRLASEERGAGGNPAQVLKYSLITSLTTAALTVGIIFTLSEPISSQVSGITPRSLCLLCISLPLVSINSAIKGYFNAYRLISRTLLAEAAEFLMKNGAAALFVQFFVLSGKMTIVTAILLAIPAGLLASIAILLVSLFFHRPENVGKGRLRLRRYIALSLPIIFNSLLSVSLSISNDVLMPLTLRQNGVNTTEALAEFGLFDAMILPVLFFPSAIISSAGQLLLPELSLARGAGNFSETRRLTERAIGVTVMISVFVAGTLVCFGGEIGRLLSDIPLVSDTIPLLAPIVPFIYLEIMLEGIIKGMGRHSFSSLNYTCEYVVRISVLLISVPVLGFTGLLISYIAANVIGNCSRFIFIFKELKTVPRLVDLVLIPTAASAFACMIGYAMTDSFTSGHHVFIRILVFLIPSILGYLFALRFASGFRTSARKAAKLH